MIRVRVHVLDPGGYTIALFESKARDTLLSKRIRPILFCTDSVAHVHDDDNGRAYEVRWDGAKLEWLEPNKQEVLF